MNASTLEGALRARGVACRVEGRAGLAILIPDDGVLTTPAGRWRRDIVRLARELGFTHVALELPAA